MARIRLGGLFVLFLALIATSAAPRSARAAASQVVETQTCVAGKANVTFSWQGNDPASTQQWLDLTIFDNGWQPGSFIGAGPLSGRSTSYLWPGLLSKTQHYIRINQQLANGAWDASGTFVFTTIDCGAATPATSGGLGASYTLLGFSDHTASGGPPPDLVAPGGTLRACNPLNLFAFVKVDNLPAPKDIFVTWYIGPTPIPRGAVTVLSSGALTLTWGFDVNSATRSNYGIRLNTDQMGAPEVEGTFTMQC
jgi:hypothetical protein